MALPAAALQFPLGYEGVVSVVAGARSAAEQRQNAAHMGATIPDAFWDELKAERPVADHVPTPSLSGPAHRQP